MKLAVTFIISVVVGACASMPKPAQTPEDKAKQEFAAKGEVYLELCETSCVIPGLFGDEVDRARKAKVEKLADLQAADISAYEAANDFANRFNRAMLNIARPK